MFTTLLTVCYPTTCYHLLLLDVYVTPEGMLPHNVLSSAPPGCLRHSWGYVTPQRVIICFSSMFTYLYRWPDILSTCCDKSNLLFMEPSDKKVFMLIFTTYWEMPLKSYEWTVYSLYPCLRFVTSIKLLNTLTKVIVDVNI